MAIIFWPDLEMRDKNVPCAICQRATSLQHATAGPCDGRGQQAFACDTHFWSSAQLILGWTDFTIQQNVAACSATEEGKVFGDEQAHVY